jgi:autonomous glycyl radical cofactor GrcA
MKLRKVKYQNTARWQYDNEEGTFAKCWVCKIDDRNKMIVLVSSDGEKNHFTSNVLVNGHWEQNKGVLQTESLEGAMDAAEKYFFAHVRGSQYTTEDLIRVK